MPPGERPVGQRAFDGVLRLRHLPLGGGKGVWDTVDDRADRRQAAAVRCIDKLADSALSGDA
jgi:hypothetical protein